MILSGKILCKVSLGMLVPRPRLRLMIWLVNLTISLLLRGSSRMQGGQRELMKPSFRKYARIYRACLGSRADGSSSLSLPRILLCKAWPADCRSLMGQRRPALCHLRTCPFASDLPEILSAGVKARLRRFHLERPADDRREHAIKRLRALVMYDPEATFLGSVVAKEASNLG